MKTLAKVLGIIIIALVVLLLGVNVYFSATPSFSDPWPVDEKYVGYYKESYEENRAAFRERCAALAKSIPGVRERGIVVQSKKTDDLSIDLCQIPSARKDRLLIMTAGLHGGEGYASSAVMRRLMETLTTNEQRPEMLFIHGVNPFGMKLFRRVTENNVDLNRNHELTDELFSVKNNGYQEVRGLLNPETPANLSALEHRFFALRAISNIALKGMGNLRQAVLQGQYEFEKGIYFGGKNFEQQRFLLEDVFRSAARDRTFVLMVDLHTGFGERGTAHLFPNAPPNQRIREHTEAVFAGYKIDWGDTADFYTTYGDFASYVGKLMPAATSYVPMVLEFGTLDSQTTKGSIDSIHRTILENQSYQYGCATPEDCAEIRASYREMFYPSSPAWRSKIMRDAEEVFGKAVERLMTL